MPPDLKIVLDEAVRTVNFIKARPLNARLFAVLCDEMGSDHRQLLLHTEVRWLSRGKVFARLYELRDEVRMFLLDSKFELSDRFSDAPWLAKLAYLADIFEHMNGLNRSLQGKTDSALKVDFSQRCLPAFWLKAASEYPELSDKALMFLMSFPTTYLCESGFSSLVSLKTKYRNRLNIEPDLRLKLSSLEPDIQMLTYAKQHHASH
ncbi:hypothetical protein JOQ06_011035 [Pogonophryne albipinna]|uniref:Zinc finger BED domain-containing protein 5 n=1 Tax=Pogonophryne albipinna TaxID=1090488 RepID=A0AAD6AYX1_9TELE|nr:hypothetical protein JOQ06_011035 [Pogonophryne albipinna]